MVVGIICVDFIFIVLSVLGLSALAQAVGGFFVVVKYLGGLYLLWLAYSLWRSSNTLELPDKSNTASEKSSALASFFHRIIDHFGKPQSDIILCRVLPSIS